MTSIFKRTTAMATGLFVIGLLGAPLALAGDDKGKHGTMDKKIVECHEAHAKMKDAKMQRGSGSGEHMNDGCYDKDGKLIGNADGHMGKDMKMPAGDHKMGDHKMDKKMRGSN